MELITLLQEEVSRACDKYNVEYELNEKKPAGESWFLPVFFHQIHDVEDIEQVDKLEGSVRYQLPPNDILVAQIPSEFHDCFHTFASE